ncbi:uncharacterized protein [Henckelia pumila]|uniref:uncharacterized protein isoform X2 n=1 Tax=Henckelia pumila TaxID=405737 RepID=UPI003C6E2F73
MWPGPAHEHIYLCIYWDWERELLHSSGASKMADKPSRALLLYGDGLAGSIGPHHTHLHSFASRACCGFLALPHTPHPGNEDARTIREFLELLDANEAFDNACLTIPFMMHQDAEGLVEHKSLEKCEFLTIRERFMGMKAAVITDNSSSRTIGDKLGLSVFQWNELCKDSHSQVRMPDLASEILGLIGFKEGKTLDTSQFDLVFAHIGANQKILDLKEIELVNDLAGEVMNIAESGIDLNSRLHMSIIMSYGSTLGDDLLNVSLPYADSTKYRELSSVVPRQSYAFKGGKPRENFRHHSPMLLAQFQNAVTRKDMVEMFSFKDFEANGGNLVIPADRLLHEVAFKLWKTPKYGA